MAPYSAIDDVPDLTNQVIIVTGANSGVGFESTRAFLRKGAIVVMACRNPKRVKDAMKRLAVDETLPKYAFNNAVFIRLDLADLKSVKQFATEFEAQFDRLDCLLNNAGLWLGEKARTTDDFDQVMGVNHLGAFALTSHLLPILEKTKGSRVVGVSSAFHHLTSLSGGFDVEDIMMDRPWRDYSLISSYTFSKLCNLLFAFELGRRLKASGSSVKSISAHPGFTHSPFHVGSITNYFVSSIGMDTPTGALSLIYACVDPSVKSGQYIGPDGLLLGSHGNPCVSKPSAESQDEELQSRLWEVSEKFTGVSYDVLMDGKKSKRVSSKRQSSKRATSKRVSSKRVSSKHAMNQRVEASFSL